MIGAVGDAGNTILAQLEVKGTCRSKRANLFSGPKNEIALLKALLLLKASVEAQKKFPGNLSVAQSTALCHVILKHAKNPRLIPAPNP